MARGAQHSFETEVKVKITPQTKLILEELVRKPLQCSPDIAKAIGKNSTWCYNRCIALLESGYLIESYSVVGIRGRLRLYRVNQEKCKHILH